MTPATSYLARIVGLYALSLAGVTGLGLRDCRLRPLLAAAPAAHLLHALQRWRGAGPAAPGPDHAGAVLELIPALALAAAALVAGGAAKQRRAASPAGSGTWRRTALAASLLFVASYHASQGLPALVPGPEVIAALERLYGWSLSGLEPGDFDQLRIYAIMMLVFSLPAVLALSDPHRHAVVVRGWAALFAAKALLMVTLRQEIQLSFGVSDARFAVQVLTISLLAAGLAALAPPGGFPRGRAAARGDGR